MNTILTKTSNPNFINAYGQAYLVKCPKCKKENYAMNVPTGICTWCGYDLNKTKTIKIN